MRTATHFQGRDGAVPNELIDAAAYVRDRYGGTAEIVIVVRQLSKWYHCNAHPSLLGLLRLRRTSARSAGPSAKNLSKTAVSSSEAKPATLTRCAPVWNLTGTLPTLGPSIPTCCGRSRRFLVH
jgi:hypothetical protein